MPIKGWSEAGWDQILQLSIVEARAGFREFVNPSHATIWGAPEEFTEDRNFRNRLYWFLRPLILAVEEVNKDPRRIFEKGDVDVVIKLFSPWTLEIDHLTFALDLNRLDKVSDLFYDSGFRTIEVIESSANLPAHGKILVREDPNTGRPLYVALLEGSVWYTPLEKNVFRIHTMDFGERTPFSLALDVSCLTPVGTTAISFRETHLEVTLPVQKFLGYLKDQDVLPVETDGPMGGLLRKDRNLIVVSFSTAPLKYGLRLEFIQRIWLTQGPREHFPLISQ